jgi:hypothetical protein
MNHLSSSYHQNPGGLHPLKEANRPDPMLMLYLDRHRITITSSPKYISTWPTPSTKTYAHFGL